MLFYLQDYTESFQKNSETRILDLFQRRYVRALIVSLSWYGTYTFHSLSNLFIDSNHIVLGWSWVITTSTIWRV